MSTSTNFPLATPPYTNSHSDLTSNDSSSILQMDNSLEKSEVCVEQTSDVAIQILQNVRDANDSLRRTTSRIQEMEDVLIIDQQQLKRKECRRRVNIIFALCFVVAMTLIGIYALFKFYFKYDLY
ncbi:EhSyntaxin J [Entamoeba marina]